MTELGWRDVVLNGALAFVFLAAFPRLAYRLRWPTRLGARGLVAYIALNTLSGFALRNWLFPYLKRMTEEQERAKQQLRHQLGRDPTEAELFAHLGLTWES